MILSQWLQNAIVLAQQRSKHLIENSEENDMVGYISSGTKVQKESGEVVITRGRWTVSAQPSGNQWRFEEDGEIFYVNDADFVPIDGDD